jgi:DNA-binding protein H-NS
MKLSRKFADLDVGALLDLRDEIDTKLHSLRSTLADQLAAIGGAVGIGRRKVGRPRKAGSPLAGRKAAAKFRDPDSGATWAGRGATPRWLRAYEAAGRSRDEFATNGAAKPGKKRGRKPGRPKVKK